MDEATSALDQRNKQLVYNMVKSHITRLANYTVIYTDHDTTQHFADAILEITGNNLVCYDNMC